MFPVGLHFALKRKMMNIDLLEKNLSGLDHFPKLWKMSQILLNQRGTAYVITTELNELGV